RPDPDAVPLPPGEVTVQVLNGTTRSGLAGDVSGQLAERGYEIDDIGNTGQASGPATIVHGPEGFLAAESVRAQLSEAEPRMDQREGTGVDLLLGTVYNDLDADSSAAETLEQPVDCPEGC